MTQNLKAIFFTILLSCSLSSFTMERTTPSLSVSAVSIAALAVGGAAFYRFINYTLQPAQNPNNFLRAAIQSKDEIKALRAIKQGACIKTFMPTYIRDEYDSNTTCDNLKRVLDLAIEKESQDLAECVHRCVPITDLCSFNFHPMEKAITSKSNPMIDFLLGKGMAVNDASCHGSIERQIIWPETSIPPLGFAIKEGKIDQALHLLGKGIDLRKPVALSAYLKPIMPLAFAEKNQHLPGMVQVINTIKEQTKFPQLLLNGEADLLEIDLALEAAEYGISTNTGHKGGKSCRLCYDVSTCACKDRE